MKWLIEWKVFYLSITFLSSPSKDLPFPHYKIQSTPPLCYDLLVVCDPAAVHLQTSFLPSLGTYMQTPQIQPVTKRTPSIRTGKAAWDTATNQSQQCWTRWNQWSGSVNGSFICAFLCLSFLLTWSNLQCISFPLALPISYPLNNYPYESLEGC